ncbi:uncharacterized protein PAC_17715 [Phialocephala subalpina]|uniref:Uncharacterized protein n=1 Tax=Phialocephala subalpina TaxID=576137 RepID=A0A1L7XRY0_9HELO|nr:uncharacterized protein PAC_17715 [Phialocephala subalpina]
MSFGFGMCDFFTLGAKAWEVYKSCKDAPNRLKNISDEVLSLHAVLKESEEVLQVQSLSPEQQGRLRTVIENLGSKSKRTWVRLGWGQQPIAEMRSRLTSNTVLLSAFVNTSQIVVEKRLNGVLRNFQEGHCEGSVISSEILCTEDAGTWRSIREELEEASITIAAFDLNRGFVVHWLRENLSMSDRMRRLGIITPR